MGADLLVDVFDDTCTTISAKDDKADHWVKCGQRVPWHLAIRTHKVSELEQELKALQVDIEAGCVTNSSYGGSWAAKEANRCQFKCDELLAETLMQLDKLDSMVDSICEMSNLEDTEVLAKITTLLRAGASADGLKRAAL